MKFKDDVIAARFTDMHPKAQEVAIDADKWCQTNYGIELTLTTTVSTQEEDKEISRVSDTHRTGRAFDVRVRDLPESLIAELCSYLRKKFGKLGANVNGQATLVVYKPHGTAPHLHIQLNRNYTKLTDYKGNQNGTT